MFKIYINRWNLPHFQNMSLATKILQMLNFIVISSVGL
jgi:hypothetical protein